MREVSLHSRNSVGQSRIKQNKNTSEPSFLPL